MSLQRKYEDEIEKQQDLRVEEQVKHRQEKEKLSFEIDFFKKELEQNMRNKEFAKSHGKRQGMPGYPGLGININPLMDNFMDQNKPIETPKGRNDDTYGGVGKP